MGDSVSAMALDGTDGLSEWELPARVSPFLEDAQDGGTTILPGGAREGLRLPHGSDRVLQLVLRPAGASRAGLVLIVAGDASDDEETRYALRTLAHQVSLALSGAELAEEIHRRASEARFATLVQNSSDLAAAPG